MLPSKRNATTRPFRQELPFISSLLPVASDHAKLEETDLPGWATRSTPQVTSIFEPFQAAKLVQLVLKSAQRRRRNADPTKALG